MPTSAACAGRTAFAVGAAAGRRRGGSPAGSGEPLAILVAGNLGYIAAHFFAVTGFLLLRRDRPDWPRPIRLAAFWIPIAVIIAALNALFIVVGASSAGLSGYAGKKELFIGIGVLLISVLLYVFRRVVQDRTRIHLREETPARPDAAAVTGR